MSRPTPRVLVTRSEPGASETAIRLRQAGFEPVVESLFAIAPIDVAIPAYDALAFTSANGVRRFAMLSPRRDAPVFCVGERTAQEARAVGYANVLSANAAVGALFDLITRKLGPGARLLHAGNEDTRGDLAGRLTEAGFQASFLPIFRAVPVEAPGPFLAAQLAGEAKFEAIMIHSPRAASILAGFAAGMTTQAPLAVAAISTAAAEPLTGFADRIEIAAAPDSPALFSALARLLFG
ncbi:MAG: uroporphyrinogen-III synthase [Hyphomonadaceae bacterium]